MSDATTPPPPPLPPSQGSSGLTIPADVAQKFGDLLEMIKSSESMNDEERQYWINILPIMTPDQIKSLRDILDNEKKQLQAIDAKYAKEMEKISQTELLQHSGEDRKMKRESRQSEEQSHKKEEDEKAEDILRAIEGDGTQK